MPTTPATSRSGPDVHLHLGDGRSYLARQHTKYNLVWYVAPDSYAATNAASSGAFVLSESYLYTTEMIKMTLQHLADHGIMVVQFGELNFQASPNRTSRYVVTARKALQELGVKDPNNHLLVAAQLSPAGDLSTIVVSRTPITAAETSRFLSGLATLPDQHAIAAPGHTFGTEHRESARVGQQRPGRIDRPALTKGHHCGHRRCTVLLALLALSRRDREHHTSAADQRP